MKTQVTVNGVTLSRAQVEAALNDLNTPDPPTAPRFRAGDRVRVVTRTLGVPYGKEGVVVGDSIGRVLAQQYDAVPAGMVRFTDGSDSWTVSEAYLLVMGTIK